MYNVEGLSVNSAKVRQLCLPYWAIVCFVCLVFDVWAQEAKKPPPDKEEKLLPQKLESDHADQRNRGWAPHLSVGTTISFVHSQRVVGAQDGQTWNLGPAIALGADYFNGPHEWRNNFSLYEVFI